MPSDGDWKTDEYGFVWLAGDWKCQPEIESYFKKRKEPIPVQYKYWETEWTKGPVGKEVLAVPELVSVGSESSSEEEPPPKPEKKKRGRPKKVKSDLKK